MAFTGESLFAVYSANHIRLSDFVLDICLYYDLLADMEQIATQQDPSLTLKQQLFVDAYLGAAQGNATLAAQIAGYKGSENTLAVSGARNLRIDKIRSAIEAKKASIRDYSRVDLKWWREQQCEVLVESREAKDRSAANVALNQLGKHLGAFEQDNRQRQNQIGMVIM